MVNGRSILTGISLMLRPSYGHSWINSGTASKRVLPISIYRPFHGCQQTAPSQTCGRGDFLQDGFCGTPSRMPLKAELRYHTSSLVNMVPEQRRRHMMASSLQYVVMMGMCTSTTYTLGTSFGRANWPMVTILVPSAKLHFPQPPACLSAIMTTAQRSLSGVQPMLKPGSWRTRLTMDQLSIV